MRSMTSSPQRQDNIHRPMALRMMNWLGRRMQWVAPFGKELSLQSITRSAGWNGMEPGHGDDGLSGLSKLIDSLNADADLTPFGQFMLRLNLVRQLKLRQQTHTLLASRPDILEQPVARPLFIVGLPRTGTTLLLNLLSQDPAGRPLHLWQALSPMAGASGRGMAKRAALRFADGFLRLVGLLAPQLRAMHPMTIDAPEECIFLLQQTFACPVLFETAANLPSYTQWLNQQDMVPHYQYYRKQLQLLQTQGATGHWVLKSPAHLFALDGLLEVFPDACVIQTHRDPTEVVASFCSLTALVRSLTCESLDLNQLGQQAVDRLAYGLEHTARVREAADPQRFCDVQYRSLLEDPIRVVAQIYERTDRHLTPEVRGRMERWLHANPKGKHGQHRYSLEQYGLDPGTIQARFSGYVSRHIEAA